MVAAPRIVSAARVARWLSWAAVLVPLLIVASPWLAETTTYGLQDWDFQTSTRYLTKLSLLSYGQAPLWNPYACGGFPAWGYVEAGTTVVSPWFVPYLVLPMRAALRVEVIGSGASRSSRGVQGCRSVHAELRRASRGVGVAGGQRTMGAPDGSRPHLAPPLRVDSVVHLLPTRRRRFRRRSFRQHLRPRSVLRPAGLRGRHLPAPPCRARPRRRLPPQASSRSPGAVAGRRSRGWRCLASSAWRSASKLLPMLHEFARQSADHRLTHEIVEPRDALACSLHRGSSSLRRSARPPGLTDGDEYGMYIGVAGVAALCSGIVLVWGAARERAQARWSRCSSSRSASGPPTPRRRGHCCTRTRPSSRRSTSPRASSTRRFCFLGLVAAVGAGRVVRGRDRVDARVLSAAVLLMAADIAWVARTPMGESVHAAQGASSYRRRGHHDFHHDPGLAVPLLGPPTSRCRPTSRCSATGGVIDCYGVPARPHRRPQQQLRPALPRRSHCGAARRRGRRRGQGARELVESEPASSSRSRHPPRRQHGRLQR